MEQKVEKHPQKNADLAGVVRTSSWQAFLFLSFNPSPCLLEIEALGLNVQGSE